MYASGGMIFEKDYSFLIEEATQCKDENILLEISTKISKYKPIAQLKN